MISSNNRLQPSVFVSTTVTIVSLFSFILSPTFAKSTLFGIDRLTERLEEGKASVDSLNLLAREVDQVITRIISYNDSLLVLLDTNGSNSPVLGGFLESEDYETQSTTEVRSVESLSLLSVGLNSNQSRPLVDVVFSPEFERIRKGQLLHSLPLTYPVDGTITSDFGMRNHPILRGRRMHKGLDMAAPSGTLIYAPGDGTVSFSGRKSGYGNTLIVDHGSGFTTLYGHCSQLLVQEGAKVKRGDIIALVGSTGRSTGPHLHYEVRLLGQHLNPEAFLVFKRDQTQDLSTIADYYLTF